MTAADKERERVGLTLAQGNTPETVVGDTRLPAAGVGDLDLQRVEILRADRMRGIDAQLDTGLALGHHRPMVRPIGVLEVAVANQLGVDASIPDRKRVR